MDQAITLHDVRLALAAEDPSLASLVCTLAAERAPRGGGLRKKVARKRVAKKRTTTKQATRRDAVTLQTVLARPTTLAFRKLDREQRRQLRMADIAALDEADGTDVVAPERLQLHSVVHELYTEGTPWGRLQLLRIIEDVPLTWGVWRGLKRIFKESEAAGDWELYGALVARLDREYASPQRGTEVRRPTLRYLLRRAWRQLRQLGTRLPAAYPDAAAEVLRHYTASTSLRGCWVANHIFFHELDGAYSRSRFKRTAFRGGVPTLTHRAFPDAWKRTPRPLFALLERARCRAVLGFAAAALKADFRTSLREVEPSWVVRLLTSRVDTVDEFVVWLLDNVPRFDPASYRELGLHDAVLGLLDSEADKAATWAASYARTHARDLPLERLLHLANNDHSAVRKLARDLLADRDPRTEVGLEGWGRLLGTAYGHKLAVTALQKHFGARELTLAWFTERLLSDDRDVVDFATEQLPKVHPEKKVPASFWWELLDHPRVTRRAAQVASRGLAAKGVDAVPADVLRRALLNPVSQRHVRGWVGEGRLPAPTLGADFLKVLADKEAFASDPWMSELRRSERPWAHGLSFDASLARWVLELLGDHRTFSADDLGFAWLFALVQRTDPDLHAFALATLSRSFKPSDFADEDREGGAEQAPAAAPEDADLGGQSFLFTGKLATMTRGEAKKKVTGAKGKNVSGVSANLDFLVIGDEGSPLYGGGRKGSKQVKAEKLIEGGAALRIISETAFLQMLAGETIEVDEDTAMAGCERLWEMATSPGPVDEPLRAFALHYLRLHHVDIHMAETDRPLDPGAELPDVFLTFDRAAEALADERAAVRALGLAWMRYELARWAPPMQSIVRLSELPHDDVRAFVELALTAPERREHRRYRLDPAILTPEAVYRFCESLQPATRALGMKLIGLHPRLAVPEELFRLTESPDRQVRAFVVRQLWALYRDRALTDGWAPPEARRSDDFRERPEQRPASDDDIRSFFRRTLFSIPPSRMPKGQDSSGLRPLPARRAKLALIEVCRDLAVEDEGFATKVTPMFEEFVDSQGQAESAACLVALTRIRARWGATGAQA